MLHCKACRKESGKSKNGNAWEKIKSSIFQFDNFIFTQVCGIATGTKVAPALARIHVYAGGLEEIFLNIQTQIPRCKTYNDYVFVNWPHAHEKFHTLLTEINQV